MAETKGYEPTPDLSALVATIERDAETWRVAALPENLGEQTYRVLLKTLRDKGSAKAVAVQVDAFGRYLSTEDIEWLANNGQENAAIVAIDRYLSREMRSAWVERLVTEGKDALACAAIRHSAYRSLPVSVARTLAERDVLASVGGNLSVFRDLDEDIALALLRRRHVREVAGNLPLFPAFSQRTADAMVDADPKSLPVIGFNLRKFRGLNGAWKQKLVDAGFKKDVEANPGSFS